MDAPAVLSRDLDLFGPCTMCWRPVTVDNLARLPYTHGGEVLHATCYDAAYAAYESSLADPPAQPTGVSA